MLKNKVFSSAIVIMGGLFATSAMANSHESAHDTESEMHSQTGTEHSQSGTYGTEHSESGAQYGQTETESQYGETGSATAQTGMEQDQGVSFEQVDEDGDGYISETEFVDSGAFQVDHKSLDTDNDGRVNQTEFAAFEQMYSTEGGQQGATGEQGWSETTPEQGMQQPQDSEYPQQDQGEWQADPTQTQDESSDY